MTDKIKLLEQEFELFIDPATEWTGNYMGHCDIKKGTIRLRGDMPKDATASTLLHEVTHLILDICGARTNSGDEQLIDNITLGLMSFIRNNKEVIEKYIQ